MFLDTNVLVRARFTAAPEHAVARARLREIVDGAERPHISRQVVREYLAVVTRPQAWAVPLATPDALRDVRWLLSSFKVLEDGPEVTRALVALCQDVQVGGRQIHDANIVATMLAHAEGRLLTFNPGDFRRFADRITVVDPTATT